MIFEVKNDEKAIFETISKAAQDIGQPVYLIGGYVRDRILGNTCKDIDIVSEGNGIDLAHAIAARLKPKPRVVVYQRFGTAMLKHRDFELEVVGARKESYRSDSRKPIVENGTIRDDQLRRDFTVNALSVSLNPDSYGKLIDPFDGLKDMQDKILRTPLDPNITFSDDPLRMLRGIRFAGQLDFTIHPDTLQAISDNARRIKIVSKERITGELEKMLKTPKPSISFKLLFDTGLLQIIFPELANLYGVEEVNGWAHKDNFYHTLQVVDNLAAKTDNVWLRWGAVLHDIAKPATKKFQPGQGWTFHGHDAVGAGMVPRIFKRLRLPLDHKMKYVQKLVRLHLRPISLTKEEITDSAVRRLLFEAGEDLDDLMLLCQADITSKNERKVTRYLKNYEKLKIKLQEVEENDRLKNWQPPIDGQTIMDTFEIPPGRMIGIIKNEIREAILDGVIPNEYDAAYQLMLDIGDKLKLEKTTSN